MPESISALHKTLSLPLVLPDAPADVHGPVKAWSEPVRIATYEPARPDKNPMFLERRVYQGSSGRVYPLPFYDRIATEPHDLLWDAIHIENEYLRIMVLPEIGGRIHIGYDKITGYDFFYRQNVIKPALVGLAGPWISGGVEFNWPQHHRPATFMPVDTEIERHADGSVTVWCGDHDPMLRMKGMHGVRLYPGRALLELNVRLYNRTPLTQTFLWWANVATRVHEDYQSFFPTDVRFVADHAKRAITSFPLSDGAYYGIDYAARASTGVPAEEAPRQFVPRDSYAPNDLSRYANIPVPTSYMIAGSSQDFFGGYDHARGAGVVHVANHHVAPGKKQWTWGNHEFGYAWDRNLTDQDGPYIELMAGVYTDNQPDFSFLAPWETKTFTQTWFPLRGMGVPQMASTQGALRLQVDGSRAHIGLQVTEDQGALTVVLRWADQELHRSTRRVLVSQPLLLDLEVPGDVDSSALAVTILRDGKRWLEYDAATTEAAKPPSVAREPAGPAEIATVEELYLTGLHLLQYRHATRAPEPYWEEALRRDPENSRVHHALGLFRLRRGEFDVGANHFQRAISRLTALNPNPYNGEPFYYLGLTERFRGRLSEAYNALYKSTWNAAWRAPAYFALAEIDASRGDWEKAVNHLERSLRAEGDHLNARNLLVLALDALGRRAEAKTEHDAIRKLDPLDIGSRWREGQMPRTGQECLDLAFDLQRAGQMSEALRVLHAARERSGEVEGSLPMVLFATAQIEGALGHLDAARASLQAAEGASLEFCFPSRLEEMVLLETVLRNYPQSASASYLLGNLLYDYRRHEGAIQHWENASLWRPQFPTVWRNLGIGLFNVRGDGEGARLAFDRAFDADPSDGRVLYERDQLWKRLGESPERRLSELERFSQLVGSRDDLSVEAATLFNQVGRPSEALHVLTRRQIQPWEGGEGLALGQYVRARLLLGRATLRGGDFRTAHEHFQAAKSAPENLGEAKHLLTNQSDLDFWLGEALEAAGDHVGALQAWGKAASQRGDFQQMAVRTVSQMTYWTGMAQRRLGRHHEAQKTLQEILAYAAELERTEPKIDYFATSLPAMLLFVEDLHERNRIETLVLRAQALAGLEEPNKAIPLLREVLRVDRNHAVAADLLLYLQDASVEVR